MMTDRSKYEDIKSEIYDPKSKITYKRGSFLGKGGFARCYEFKNIATGEVFAGKVVSKKALLKPHHKEKMAQEIRIHSTMSHHFIVLLHSYFEDESNLYIILELCRKRSLMEMHKRRKTLTPPEVRYFMRQIILACVYMHENRVIHRDLKLGNLFINDSMEIKVGDFGLATRLSHDGERKKTVCGTPNYIAPEILLKKGHSYEVDIWSLGCIMYTLLVGSPPFETSSLKTTYMKIKNNEYHLPQRLESSAKRLIQKLLHPNPECRPCAAAILKDEFFDSGYVPKAIPASCLVMQPRLTQNMTLLEESKVSTRKPLSDKNGIDNIMESKEVLTTAAAGTENAVKKEEIVKTTSMPADFYLKDLLDMLESVVKCNPDVIYSGNPEDAQDPSVVPFVWISKWVDYTDKYGVGYQLCDNSIGVLFNDLTHMILLADGKTLQYINRNNEEQYCTRGDHPKDLNKKITLLNYFNTYMSENLLTAGENAKPREGDEMTQVPHLRAWLRTKSAIVFHLTNGTFQANFFKDHTKIILCPIMGAVSYIDEEKNFTVYTFKLIEKYGCPQYLASRIRYARGMLEKLYNDFKETKSKKK